MNDRSHFGDTELPPGLAELDTELSSLRYAERSSFRPELEAELVKEWSRARRHRAASLAPRLAAAGIAALLVALVAPSARASLVQLFEALQGDAGEAPVAVAKGQPTVTPGLQPEATSVRPDPGAVDAIAGPAADLLSLPFDPWGGAGPFVAYDARTSKETTFPELTDRSQVADEILRRYPRELQSAGVGGTVRVRLWVDSTGAVDFVTLGRESGLATLDRAAMQAASDFKFEPARRMGKTVGTWVEFDVVFQAQLVEPDVAGLTEVGPVDAPRIAAPVDLSPLPVWTDEVVLPSPVQREAGELLRSALNDASLIRRLGPIEAMLEGEPPAGVAPMEWRADVAKALEKALGRDPDNPAPPLALARLRRKQGLRTEAQSLFERGIKLAQRSPGAVSPTLVAELHYGRGTLMKETWLGSNRVGSVPAEALADATCPAARSSAGATETHASVERVIAWNYLCPAELRAVFASSFEPVAHAGAADMSEMLSSFRSAVEADPAHARANLEMLVALADEKRWEEVLEGANHFIEAAPGYPSGLLMAGIALQRLSRTDEAEVQFELAFRVLPTDEVAEIQDISAILDRAQGAKYSSLGAAERQAWVSSFWDGLDPILSTSVNEREVEHYARTSYARLRFGATDSDPGEVWVRYGAPNQIRVFAEGSGLRTELWDYGSGPDITFRRLASAARMELTPEGRAYIDELRRVVPSLEGPISVAAMALPTQLSRFRGSTPGSTDIEIQAMVPEELLAAGSDALDFGVFVLGRQGEPLAVTTRELGPEGKSVSLSVTAPPLAAAIVVEVFDDRSRRAAVARGTTRLNESATGPTASDLMLVQAAPEAVDAAEVRRGASWIVPVVPGEAFEGNVVGALFELYDVAPPATWYRVQAEVMDRVSRETRPVPIRPAEASEFRALWNRTPKAKGPTVEILAASLRDVPTGSYVLRVSVEFPGGGTPLVLERDLERR